MFKYSVIGCGAVGGYYGALLAKAGLDIHFLCRSDYQHIQQNGLKIESKQDNFTLSNLQVYDQTDHFPQCDVAIVALKTISNPILKEILPSILKKGGVILILQNGLTVEQEIASWFPDMTVIGGMCFLCSYKLGPGHVHHLDYGLIRLASYKIGNDEDKIMLQLTQDFHQAGIPVQVSNNLMKTRWEKLVWNIPYNGLSVILSATTGQLMNHYSSRQLIKNIMLEVISTANHLGFNIEENFADTLLKNTDNMVDYKPSMKLDYERKQPLEIEQIYCKPLLAADAVKCKMPYTAMLMSQLLFLTASY